MHPADWFTQIPWFAWIAIVAILVGGIDGIVKSLIRHRERMALIEQGIDPGPDESSGGCGLTGCGSRKRRRERADRRAADSSLKSNLPEL